MVAFPWTAAAPFGDREGPSRGAASPLERGSGALSLLCPAPSLSGYLGVKVPDQRSDLSCLLLGVWGALGSFSFRGVTGKVPGLCRPPPAVRRPLGLFLLFWKRWKGVCAEGILAHESISRFAAGLSSPTWRPLEHVGIPTLSLHASWEPLGSGPPGHGGHWDGAIHAQPHCA